MNAHPTPHFVPSRTDLAAEIGLMASILIVDDVLLEPTRRLRHAAAVALLRAGIGSAAVGTYLDLAIEAARIYIARYSSGRP